MQYIVAAISLFVGGIIFYVEHEVNMAVAHAGWDIIVADGGAATPWLLAALVIIVVVVTVAGLMKLLS